MLRFSLLENNMLGTRKRRVFADGLMGVKMNDVVKEEFLTISCNIKNIIDKKIVLNLTLVIQEDLEKVNFNIPDTQPSEILELSEYSDQEDITKILPDPFVPLFKESSIRNNLRKSVRPRRFEYSIKSEHLNHEINNKVTDEISHYIENVRINLDEAISSIEFYGKRLNSLLAQVLFKTNPSEEEIKGLKIKIPESEKIVDIYLQTMEGTKLHAETNLPELDENECLKIECSFRDSNNTTRASMRFNYKDELMEDRLNGVIKMQMGREGTIIDNKKIKDHVNFLPFLFPNFNNKYQDVLHLTKTKQVDDTEATLSRSNKTIEKYQMDNMNEFEHSLKLIRTKGVSSKSMRLKTNFTSNKLPIKNQIKIYKLSINLYPNHHPLADSPIEEHHERYVFIYTNISNSYITPNINSEHKLNWDLDDCLILITNYEKLSIELRNNHQMLLGELTISYSQLKQSCEENATYMGYITKNEEIVGKISMHLKLSNAFNEKKNRVLDRIETSSKNKRVRTEETRHLSNDKRKPIQTKSNFSFRYDEPHIMSDILRRKQNKTVLHEDIGYNYNDTPKGKRKSKIILAKM